MMDMKMKPSAMGYGVKSGRLVRTAPCPEMGITKMVKMNQQMKRMDKVSMMAEAFSMGEMMADARKEYNMK